ncbi:MAG: phosphoglucosamine mutase [Clostridia bacterium]|nr:phosphoglucosamine mutase [Clostridia bacterium]
MGLFFGTDGLRGKVNDTLSSSIAYKVGNALGSNYGKVNVLVGQDTRVSGDLIMLAFCTGLVDSGANVTSVGVCPTAGVAYLAKTLNFDFGVVISASHNPAEFNGIKIFNKNATKISEEEENDLERKFLNQKCESALNVGLFSYKPSLKRKYIDFLTSSISVRLDGLKVVLDCANGAASFIAPKVFRKLGAKVKAISNLPDGKNINDNCGALYPENLVKFVVKSKFDVGFAFDGDSDRVIAVNEQGRIVNGDDLLFLFGKDLKQKNKLKGNCVVGTAHTNTGVEVALKRAGISLIRTQIGDKFVSQALIDKDLFLGGEQSGHIIMKTKLETGDGILNALNVCEILVRKQKSLSKLISYKPYFQSNVNVKVDDKFKIINSEELSSVVLEEEKRLMNGRIMVRVSGTEPFIRIMVESKSEKEALNISNNIKNVIQNLNK